MRRIGIDVGGTNTDAVLLEDARVVHAVKTPTTEDVTGGIVAALGLLMHDPQVAHGAIDGVVIGTTHFGDPYRAAGECVIAAVLRLARGSGRLGARRGLHARRRARI